MATAWAVLTVSSEPQVGTLQHQRAWAELLTGDKGWRLTRVFEGVASGKAGPRAVCRDVLLEMRAAPPEARPDYVLMIRLDRVGRGSIVDSQIFVRDLRALGAKLFTRDSGEIRLDSAMDELIAAVQMAVARHENDVRSEKIRAVHRRRAAAGEPQSNRAPYGLYIQLKPRIYVVLPTHLAVMQALYAKRIAGERIVDIARWMRANAPPLFYKNGSEFNLNWSHSRIKRVISNRAYIGTIVDEATWLRAQRVSKYVGKFPPRVRRWGEFVLGGMLRCECGRALTATARNISRALKNQRPPNRYYNCAAPWNHDEKQRTHLADAVEQRFEKLLLDLMLRPERHVAFRAYADYGQTIAKLDNEIARLKARLETIASAKARVWRLDDAGLIEPLEISTRLGDLNAKAEAVKAKIVVKLQQRVLCVASRQDGVDVAELCRTARGRYDAGDFAQKVAVTREVVSSLGGLRVTKGGALIAGRGKHATPQERLKKYDPACWQSRPRVRGQFVAGPLSIPDPRNADF